MVSAGSGKGGAERDEEARLTEEDEVKASVLDALSISMESSSRPRRAHWKGGVQGGDPFGRIDTPFANRCFILRCCRRPSISGPCSLH